MSRADRLRVACTCALAQWALALAIQIGNYFGYLLPPGRDWKAGAVMLTLIPLIQAQNAMVAALFGVAAYFAAANRITAWIFFGIFCAGSAYLLIDQVYYKVFLDHIRVGAFESGRQFNLTITLGSFKKEADWIFYVATLVAILGAMWFARALRPKPSQPRKFRYALEVAAALAIVGLPAYSSKQYGHVNEHALVELARDLGRQSLGSLLAGRGVPGHALAAYRSDQPADDDPRLAAVLAASGSRNPRPNIVLIVLESVGAINLLGADGLPFPGFAPNLAMLARNGIVFNSIYTTFPGTTRSLISLHTSGRQPTYGWAPNLLSRYQGPVLARTAGDLGYRTACFSSERMDGEGTDAFLKQTGYEKYYDFSADAHVKEPRYQIHSWGAREEHTLGLVEDWIAGGQSGGKPFLLEYLNAATHHPYGAPPGYPVPFPPHDRNADYVNALHYTDRAIGTLADFLQKRGLLKDTIIVVTGDHGEAFGERHGDNYLHKNFTYDENIREFLLIYDGQLVNRKLIDKPLTSSRVGSNGDIVPTLLALLGAPPPAVPGRSLLGARFETRPVFFHKLAAPETWGLRDGRWKYIGEIRSPAAELYDLEADPTEQKNLASAQPGRVAQYREMCQEWYLESEHEFTLRLKGHKEADTAPAKAGSRRGASVLAIGSWQTSEKGWFVEKSVANPHQLLVAWTKWTGDPDYAAQYEWISPGGRRMVSLPIDSEEWHVTYGAFPGELPMEEGVWSVHLREKDQVHLTTQFSVRF